jgi:hypothetical protein
MIPVEQIVQVNLYSQDDACFLMGDGFTAKSAKEAICQACRTGQLENRLWRKRYWFTGRAFLEWLRRWFGELELAASAPTQKKGVALALPRRQDTAADAGPVRRSPGGEVDG